MTQEVVQRYQVGEYEFEAVTGHGFPHPEFPLVMWRFWIKGSTERSEMYQSLDRAMVSAVGQKHTGPRGAGGSGVGTAADWFCVMVGLDHDEDDARRARTEPPASKIELCPYTQSHTREFCGVAGCRER